MCIGCVAVAGLVIAATPLAPIQIQPIAAVTEVTVASRALTPFAANARTISSAHQRVIRSLVLDNSVGERIICTGLTLARDSAATKSRTKARAKSACDFAKRINPDLRTSVLTRNTTLRASAGRVTLQIRQTPAPIPDTSIAEPPTAKSPFETPFPTVFTKEELVTAALANTKTYFEANSKPKDFNLAFESTIPEEERGWMTKQVTTVMSVLPFRDGYRPLIVVGSTDAFINSELARNGVQGNSPQWWCGSETVFERACAGFGWAGLNFKYSIESKMPIRDAGRRSLLAHEIYHIWHKTVDGSVGNNNADPNSPNGLPRWFMEGSANFFGFAIADFDKSTTYREGRVSQVDSYLQASSIPLRDHVTNDPNPYGIGQAATEYLVASIGVERFLSIFRGIGEGKTFASSFFDASGITLEVFFVRFEQVRPNL